MLGEIRYDPARLDRNLLAALFEEHATGEVAARRQRQDIGAGPRRVRAKAVVPG